MMYVEVFAFASFLVPLAVAFTPVCVPSSQGVTIETIGPLSKTFCAGLEKKNFMSDLQVYGVPNVSLGFIPANGTNPCDLNNCLSSYDSLVESCQYDSHSIWGCGTLGTGCGTYAFTIMNSIGGTGNDGTTPPSASPQPSTSTEISPSILSSTVASPTSSAPASTTKPIVGTATLGSGGERAAKVSGASLAAVAGIFLLFM